MVVLLRSAPPDAVVILRGDQAFTGASLADYTSILRVLEELCPVTRRVGPYEIRTRGAP
jgi:hypothetical protein